MSLMLSWVLSLAAAAQPPVCPFAAGDAEQDRRVGLMGDRVAIDLNTEGAELPDWLERAGGPHQIETLDFWKQLVRWDSGILFLADPLLLASEDLEPVAQAVARHYTSGEAFVDEPAWIPMASNQSGTSGLLLGGLREDGSWAVAGVMALPEGDLIEVGLYLSPPVGSDTACQDAALARLRSMGPGLRPQDNLPREQPMGLFTSDASVVLPIPEGYALQVSMGMEHSFYKLLEWVPFHEQAERGQIVVGFSHLNFITPPPVRHRGDRVARGRFLGRRVVWTDSVEHENVEETFLRSFMGTRKKGTIRVEIAAPTPEERAALREVAVQIRIEPAPPEADDRGE